MAKYGSVHKFTEEDLKLEEKEASVGKKSHPPGVMDDFNPKDSDFWDKVGFFESFQPYEDRPSCLVSGSSLIYSFFIQRTVSIGKFHPCLKMWFIKSLLISKVKF